MRTRSSLVLALLLSALASTGEPLIARSAAEGEGLPQPESAELPDAEELFEACTEAMGGMENLRKQRNKVLHGVYQDISTGDTQVLTLYCEAPNKIRAELDAPGLGSTVRATNGEVAWGTNVTGTPVRLQPRETAVLNDSAVFLGEAGYKERYASYKTVAKSQFDGRSAYQVDFVTKSGLEGSVFFDTDSKLMVARQLRDPAKPNESMLVLVKNYKEFGGVMIPTQQQQRFVNVQVPNVEIDFRWVEIDVDELPSFEPPEQLAEAEEASGG